MSSHTALFDAGASVADGRHVDWDRVASELQGEERELLEQLKIVAEIAALHRTGAEDEAEGLGKVVGRIGPLPEAVATPRLSATVDESLHPAGAAVPGLATEPPDDRRRWAHYELLEQVGEGAFGQVYRAIDETLAREVAVKLLHAREDADATVSRMLREGRALAQVRHPNVVAVYAAESHGGRAGLSMEFIRGETLEELIAERGPMSAREASLVGEDVCRALAAVHAAGLVHRDIKARNVMREEGGRIVLMDFGTGQARRDPTSRASSVTGTPLCLAPEVLAGREASVRSDIYSLGVLLYYLVTGRYPRRAASLEELKAAHARAYDSLRDLRPTLPESFVRVVERALEHDPAARFESAGACQAALAVAADDAAHVGPVSTGSEISLAGATALRASRARLVSAAVVAFLALATGVGWLRWSQGGAVEPVRSMTVLPFQNRVPSAEYDYIGVGLADVLLARLTNVGALELRRPRYTAAAAALDPVQSGRQIGVDAVLSGSYAVRGDVVDVAYSLTDVRRNVQLAGNALILPLPEMDRVEETIRQDLDRVLHAAWAPPAAGGAAAQPAKQARAFQELLRSNFELDRFWQQPSAERLGQAERHLLLALDEDPQSTLSLVSLAKLRWVAAFSGYAEGDETLRRAETSAKRALELDPSYGEAYAALALVQFQRGEIEAMRDNIRRSLKATPSSALGLYAAGFYFLANGLAAQGVTAFESARRIDPSLVRREVGIAHRYAGEFDTAADEFRRVLAENPTDMTTMKMLAAMLQLTGRLDEAAALERTLDASIPNDVGARLRRVTLAVSRGDGSGIDPLMAELGETYWADPGFSTNVASMFALAERPREAARWLGHAGELGMQNHPYVIGQPAIAKLAGDPHLAPVLDALHRQWSEAVGREARDPLLPTAR